MNTQVPSRAPGRPRGSVGSASSRWCCMTVRILGAARGRVHGHGDVVEFMAAVVWRGWQVLLVGRWLSVSAGVLAVQVSSEQAGPSDPRRRPMQSKRSPYWLGGETGQITVASAYNGKSPSITSEFSGILIICRFADWQTPHLSPGGHGFAKKIRARLESCHTSPVPAAGHILLPPPPAAPPALPPEP
jgi:hypothetical protein